MFTPAFDRYVEPARTKSQIWRLVVGFVLIVALYLVWVALMFTGIRWLASSGTAQLLADEIVQASTPIGVLLLFASFIGAGLATMAVVQLLHRRSPRTLLGPPGLVLHDFSISACVVMGFNAVVLLLISFWLDPVANLKFGPWAFLLPLSIAGLLVQTLTEELVFRGYLQQQLAARFRSPLIWMLLPSIGFASLHFDPATTGDNTWLILGVTGVFALLAADLTRVTGSLGAAWGFHFANNFWAILLLAVNDGVTGLALYVTPYGADDTLVLPALIFVDLVGMLIIWRILRKLLQR